MSGWHERDRLQTALLVNGGSVDEGGVSNSDLS